jgi:hypothetical protein
MFLDRKVSTSITMPPGVVRPHLYGALPGKPLRLFGSGDNEGESTTWIWSAETGATEVRRGYCLRSLHPDETQFQTTQGERHYLIDPDGHCEPDAFLDSLAQKLDLTRLERVNIDPEAGWVAGNGQGMVSAYQTVASVGWFATLDGEVALRASQEVETQMCYISGGRALGVRRPHRNRVDHHVRNLDWEAISCTLDRTSMFPDIRESPELIIASRRWPLWSMPLRREHSAHLCLIHTSGPYAGLTPWAGTPINETSITWLGGGGCNAHYAGQSSDGTILFVLNSAKDNTEQCYALWQSGAQPEIFTAANITGLPAGRNVTFLNLAGDHLVASASGGDDTEFYILED